MSKAYYNEFDSGAAAWLRELIRMGAIADGDVDERSIEDVYPSDLHGYTQCHFFAGIGGWSYALRLAGWPDDRPVWTGSCPCQPFSAAGKGSAFADERHLWPAFLHLIKERKPSVVFGEQVASKDAEPWLDLVQADLEGLDYAVGAVPFPSAGIGAPHIRDRLYWVADAAGSRFAEQRRGKGESKGLAAGGSIGWVADMHGNGCNQTGERIAATGRDGAVGNCAIGLLGNPANKSRQWHPGGISGQEAEVDCKREFDGGNSIGFEYASASLGYEQPGPTNGFWRAADWLLCRDGKWRPVEPGTFPLVDGLPRGVVPSSRIGMAFDANKTAEARVMRLRGYGNAINPIQAALFVEVFMESMSCQK